MEEKEEPLEHLPLHADLGDAFKAPTENGVGPSALPPEKKCLSRRSRRRRRFAFLDPLFSLLKKLIRPFLPVITNPIVLFVATSMTTIMAGAFQEGVDFQQDPAGVVKGIPFAFTLMTILFTHEMGHYITSKKYGVDVSGPFFIPCFLPGLITPPFGLIGTFGALIKIKSPIFKKNALLDIGAAGPIAGFVVSIIAVAVGLYSSQIVAVAPGGALLHLGDPLIFTMIAGLLGKIPPEGHDIALSSVAFAGWIGFFVTSLNLLPLGQFDGGHIVYALIGKKAHYVSRGMVLVLLYSGYIGWGGWIFWACLGLFFGVRHPPIVDEETPLDFKHWMVAITSIIIFVVTFMPTPFMTGP